MELVFENGWNGNRGLFDKLTGFQRDMDEAAGSPMAPRTDVIEDKDAYHFYFEMPGLKVESLDVQVENDQLSVAAERKKPEWPQETALHIAGGATVISDAHSGFRSMRAETASVRPTLTAYSN